MSELREASLAAMVRGIELGLAIKDDLIVHNGCIYVCNYNQADLVPPPPNQLPSWFLPTTTSLPLFLSHHSPPPSLPFPPLTTSLPLPPTTRQLVLFASSHHHLRIPFPLPPITTSLPPSPTNRQSVCPFRSLSPPPLLPYVAIHHGSPPPPPLTTHISLPQNLLRAKEFEPLLPTLRKCVEALRATSQQELRDDMQLLKLVCAIVAAFAQVALVRPFVAYLCAHLMGRV